MEASKLCGRCQSILPVSLFAPHSRAASGLQSYCRPCQNAASKECYQRKRAKLPQKVRPAVKPCRHCGVVKPIEDFSPNGGQTKGGAIKRHANCRKCVCAKRAAASPPREDPIARFRLERLKCCTGCKEVKPWSGFPRDYRLPEDAYSGYRPTMQGLLRGSVQRGKEEVAPETA